MGHSAIAKEAGGTFGHGRAGTYLGKAVDKWEGLDAALAELVDYMRYAICKE